MYIEFDGLRVSWRVMGKGRSLVLLHGYPEAGEVWQPMKGGSPGNWLPDYGRMVSRKPGSQSMIRCFLYIPGHQAGFCQSPAR